MARPRKLPELPVEPVPPPAPEVVAVPLCTHIDYHADRRLLHMTVDGKLFEVKLDDRALYCIRANFGGH